MEANRGEDVQREKKSAYMTPQGWNPPEGLQPIPIGANMYIMQAPVEVIKNNEQSGTGHRSMTSQNQRISKAWNYRQLVRLKYCNNVVQEGQIGQLWLDL